MPVPDVLGYKLDEALRILADAGWKASVLTTYPPRRENIAETRPPRVLRVTVVGEHAVQLIVAYEGAGEGCSGCRPGDNPGL